MLGTSILRPLDHDAGAAVELNKVFGARARDFRVGDPWVVAPCQALEEVAPGFDDRIRGDRIAIAAPNRTMCAQIGMDVWVAVMGRNIALVVDAPLQVVEARHGNVEVWFSACWVAAAGTLIVHPHDHLATSRRSQQSTLPTAKEAIAGGSRSIHGCSHVVNTPHCGMV